MIKRRLAIIIAVFGVSGCPNLPIDDPLNPHSQVDWVALGNDQIPILKADTQMGQAAVAVRGRYPNLADAADDPLQNWRDAHPTFLINHGELAGFGVTMVLQSNDDLIPGPEDFAFAQDNIQRPTLLFFERTGAFNTGEWPIIGMGYGYEYVDETGDGVADPPQFLDIAGRQKFGWNLVESSFFLRDGVLTHEAGYHQTTGPNPGFEAAANADLTPVALANGLRMDNDGLHPVGHEHMQDGLGEHGRIWAMHVWFDPATGRPTVSPCDPWHRQRAGAAVAPFPAFFYRNDPLSRAIIGAQCLGGGVYPTIANLAP